MKEKSSPPEAEPQIEHENLPAGPVEGSPWEKTKLDLKEALEMWSKPVARQTPETPGARPTHMDRLFSDLKEKLQELSS